MTNANITNIMNILASKLNVPIHMIWQAAIHKVIFDGWLYIVFSLLFLIISSASFIIGYFLKRSHDDNDWLIVGVGFGMFFLIICIVFFISGLDNLCNTHYVALQYIASLSNG